MLMGAMTNSRLQLLSLIHADEQNHVQLKDIKPKWLVGNNPIFLTFIAFLTFFLFGVSFFSFSFDLGRILILIHLVLFILFCRFIRVIRKCISGGRSDIGHAADKMQNLQQQQRVIVHCLALQRTVEGTIFLKKKFRLRYSMMLALWRNHNFTE